jgi:fructose-1,6-bisphosphatase-3
MSNTQTGAHTSEHERYLRLLSRQYPTTQDVYTKIIDLEARLELPKPTEHFMSDVHGEYLAFDHILNNCSGVVREHVEAVFGNELDEWTKDDLCTLVYYPNEKLAQIRSAHLDLPGWYWQTLMRLIRLARRISEQYSRFKVRQALPEAYAGIIEELLHASGEGELTRHAYHKHIVDSIVAVGAGGEFLVAIAELVKRLAVYHLHMVGDVYDRGPHADRIMDDLMAYHSIDVQWGNHDIVWMGAAAGSETCIASVVRTQIRYNTLATVESGYGISLRRLALFAERTYRSDDVISPLEKAISVILFKMEGQLIGRHPNYHMDDRLLLGSLDLTHGTVRIGDTDWPLKTCDFPTVDPDDPYALTSEEQDVMDGLVEAFRESDRLHRHAAFLFEKGSVYLVHNGNLLFHGCVPLDEDGSLSEVVGEGVAYRGKGYLDFCDRVARRAWHRGDQRALDWMWYLWCGRHSPLSGRVMKTFERTFVDDRRAWVEREDPYFRLTENREVCEAILADFGLTGAHSHIVNGHKPVREREGESPVKGDARRLVVDGGFCEAYHKTTGIAGYTLISSADGLRIKAHRPFLSVEAALAANADILSNTTVIEREEPRLRVAETDHGRHLAADIADLHELLDCYRDGTIKEREG